MPKGSVWALFGAAVAMTALSWVRVLVTGSTSLGTAWLPGPWDIASAVLLLLILAWIWTSHRAMSITMGDVVLSSTQVWRFAGLGIALIAVAIPMMPLLTDDVFSTLAYSDLACNTGVNPFTLPSPGLGASVFAGDVYQTWRGAPCVYGPVQIAFWAPAVVITDGNLLLALVVVKILAGMAVAATLVILAVHVSRKDHPPVPGALFALFALNPVLWLLGAGQASNDAVAALFLALWIALAWRGHVLVAAIAIGLAVSSKAPMALPAGMWLLYLLANPGAMLGRKVRDTAMAGLTIVSVVVVAHVPFWEGPQTVLEPLSFLSTREPTNTFFEPVYIVATLLGGERANVIAVLGKVGGVVFLAGLVVAALVAVRTKTFGDLVARAGMALMLLLTLSTPVFHPWYLLPGLVMAVEIRDLAWRRWLLLGTIPVISVCGTGLLPLGGIPRTVFTVVTTGLSCVVWLWGLRGRITALVR